MRSQAVTCVAIGLLASIVAMFWPAISQLPPRVIRAGVLEARGPVPERTGWASFGGTQAGGQYSSLAKINRDNIARLEVAWTHRSGDLGVRSTPILVNGSLYYCTSAVRVIALDPATGTQRWATDLDAAIGADGADINCRGVTYWEDTAAAGGACGKRIFMGDGRSRLYAVDADTGELCTDFGKGGYVDLQDFDNYGKGNITLPSPPAVYRDLVIIGGGLSDNVDIRAAPDGMVRALDARTGREAWHFDPIPPQLRQATGAGNVWSQISVDADNGIVYLPTSSPAVDAYGANRPGDLPFTDALVALKAETGEVLWHFQTVHHDLFDYDLPAQPILFELVRGTGRIPAVAQITKTGFVFVFNRLTGEPLFPIEERPAPRSDIPGERASPSQPVPGLPPFAQQQFKREQVFGLTWLDRAACQSTFDRLRYEGLFTPASLRGSILFPTPAGAANWGAAALDPAHQLLIVRAQNIAAIWRLEAAGDDRPTTPRVFELNDVYFPMLGTPYVLKGGNFSSPLGIPCTPPPWGQLTAIDLGTGKIVWQVPFGQVQKGLFKSPAAWGSPLFGGPLATAGGLVFMGGALEGTFRAMDIATGETLWKAELPAPAMAVPMTYEADGRQFVVVAAGGFPQLNTALADTLIAFVLPK